MRILLISLLMTSCGIYARGKTEHEVKGDATVHIVVGVDVAACSTLPEADRLACIEALIELAKTISEQQDNQPGIGF